jgi:hypothetical protein
VLKAPLKPQLKQLFIGVALLAVSLASNAQDNTENIHDVWHTLVSENVLAIKHGHSTEVDYAAMQAQRGRLKTYLDALTSVTQNEFDTWEKPKQLAFLINAYNAWTVELILTKYPHLKSIKDLGHFLNSPWSKAFIPLLGKTRSLDDIEHDLIRGSGKYNDPRIHFAVNCASIGCPALRAEAYTAADLDAQLQAQTIRFLSDNTRNKVQGNTLSISSIFKWYGDDFALGFRGSNSVGEFILQYPDALKLLPAQQTALKNETMRIKFLDYNWDLNARH